MVVQLLKHYKYKQEEMIAFIIFFQIYKQYEDMISYYKKHNIHFKTKQ